MASNALTTPTTSRSRRTPRSSSQPRTPKDVRQLDREEMIAYLQQHDAPLPDDPTHCMRASLQKRVIQCMKQQQSQKVSESPIPFPQSAIPNTKQSRKRKADIAMTGTTTKKMKLSNTAFLMANPGVPKTSLFAIPSMSIDEHKDHDPDLGLSHLTTLQLNFDASTVHDRGLADDGDALDASETTQDDGESQEMKTSETEMDDAMNKLLLDLKKGVPARYDLLPLPHSIMNLDTKTEYVRSSKMQALYQACCIEHELQCQCTVRTIDDVYGLNDHDIQQIEANVTQWVHKYGEYSAKLHPSICEDEEHQKLKSKDHIFQYEILGRFIGDEMIEHEFNEIYAGTFDECRRSLHSWVIEVNVPLLDVNGAEFEQYEMLIDCLGKTDKAHSKLLLIEDCRADLHTETTTKEDLKKENVLFVTIEINGWPAKFAVAKRSIGKNERLYGHFGEGYGSLRKQVQRQKQSVNYFLSNICKQISVILHQ